MIEKKITVTVEQGLQARAAAQFVQVASAFSSDINLVKNQKKLVAKSIMGVMGAAIRPGEKVTLMADGADEEKAIQTLEEFLSKEKGVH